MSDELIGLARPVIGEREEELVLEALRSRRLALGPMLPEFERALGSRLGVGHVSAVSSGTAALHLAIRAAGIEGGDEVVTTPFSFVASANCMLFENARPVFCDIDRRTLNIDPGAAAAAVGSARPGCCRCMCSATRRTCPRSSAWPGSAGYGWWRTPARRSAPCAPTAAWWAPAATWPRSASTPTSR